MSNIFSLIRQARQSYKTDKITIVEGYEYNQYETLKKVELYYNSKFLSGNTDDLGREKPFYNINKFRVNVATRATDIDVKDIVIEAEGKENYLQSYLLNKENRNWMKDTNFSYFLNRLGHTRAKYGGVLVKKTEKGDNLYLDVVDWRNVITDQTDIVNGIIIERHYYTPAQLREMEKYGWENVDEAILLTTNKKADIISVAGNEGNGLRVEDNMDNYGSFNSVIGNYIEVYEVHGELPETYLREDGDPKKYVRQIHILAGVDNIIKNEDGEYVGEGGVVLFKGEEKENPYKYLAWDKMPGRGLGVGVVEDTEEAQVWTNDAIMKEKELMELASKLIFQTTDQTIIENILTDVDNGQIIKVKPGHSLTQVNNIPGSLPEFQNLVEKWRVQADRTTSTFEAITGETLPSGTPFRQALLLNQEATSIFDYRREEAAIFIREIYQDWILPYLLKRVKKAHTLEATLDGEELEFIDNMIANKIATKEYEEAGVVPLYSEYQNRINEIKTELRKTGNRRYFDIEENFYSNIKYRVSVIITNEQKNKAVMLESLNNVLSTILKAPQILQDPKMKKLFNKILEIAGISPIEFETTEPIEVETQQPQGQNLNNSLQSNKLIMPVAGQSQQQVLSNIAAQTG